LFGAVPKWPKGEVCKTSIRGFDSHPRLQAFLQVLPSVRVFNPETQSVVMSAPFYFAKVIPADLSSANAVLRNSSMR
jgi:hypothetical protein